MGILLDPNKSFVSIDLYYIEDIKPHGNSIFHFVNSRDDLEEWKRKGYRTLDEIQQMKQTVEKQPEAGKEQPGAAIPQLKYDPSKVIQKLNTQWKRMTWKDQNVIFSRSLKTVPQGDGRNSTELDTIKYRDLKLKTCLKKWDLRDDANHEVPCTEEMIDLLDPLVATELLSNFEKVTEASEDEKKG